MYEIRKDPITQEIRVDLRRNILNQFWFDLDLWKVRIARAWWKCATAYIRYRGADRWKWKTQWRHNVEWSLKEWWRMDWRREINLQEIRKRYRHMQVSECGEGAPMSSCRCQQHSLTTPTSKNSPKNFHHYWKNHRKRLIWTAAIKNSYFFILKTYTPSSLW